MIPGIVLVGCFIIGLTADKGQPGWTTEELAKGLRARDQAIKSYGVDEQFQVRTRSDHTGKRLDYATASHVEVDRTTGRFFVHRLGQLPMPPAPSIGKKEDWFTTQDVLIAFDGERTKVMSKSTGVDPKTGRDAKSLIKTGQIYPGRRPSWAIDPDQYIGMFQGKSIADRLTSDPDQTRSRGRFWIDVTKNFAVQRIESAFKQGTFSSWRPFVNATVDDWVEVEGFWLPSRYHLVSRPFRLDPVQPHRPAQPSRARLLGGRGRSRAQDRGRRRRDLRCQQRPRRRCELPARRWKHPVREGFDGPAGLEGLGHAGRRRGDSHGLLTPGLAIVAPATQRNPPPHNTFHHLPVSTWPLPTLLPSHPLNSPQHTNPPRPQTLLCFS